MDAGILQALVGSGPLGLLIVYLILERKSDTADRKAADAARADYNERRLQADLKMSAALTVLALKITGRPSDDQS